MALKLAELRAKRNEELTDEFERRKGEKGIADALAVAYGVNRVQVYRIVKAVLTARKAKDAAALKQGVA